MSNKTIKTFTSNSTWVAPAGITSVQVEAVENFSVPLMGGFSQYLIDPNGFIYSWGTNSNGVLGLGDVTNRSSPILVSGVLNFEQIHAEDQNNIFALTSAGSLYAWGVNGNGALGTNDTANRSSPTPVVGGLVFSQVIPTSGNQAFALTPEGAAYAWGTNTNGQLGDGTVTNRSSPVPVVGGIVFKSLIQTPGDYMMGFSAGGSLYAWGHNQNGQLGDGTSTGRSSPVLVATDSLSIKKVIAAGGANYILTTSGVAYAWGDNSGGLIGDGTTTNRSSPVLVAGGLTFTDLFSGSSSLEAFGITASGDIYGWGNNVLGQLGDGTTTNRSSPVLVVGGLTFKTMFSTFAGNQSYAITTANQTYGWGTNTSGQLGDGTNTSKSSPVLVLGGLTFKTITAQGSGITPIGLTTGGAVYSWGLNTNGSIGDGTVVSKSSPVLVAGGLSVLNSAGKLNSNFVPVIPGVSYSVQVGAVCLFGNTAIALGRPCSAVKLTYGK